MDQIKVRFRINGCQGISFSSVRATVLGRNDENLTYIRTRLGDTTEVETMKGFLGGLEFTVKSSSDEKIELAHTLIADLIDTVADELIEKRHPTSKRLQRPRLRPACANSYIMEKAFQTCSNLIFFNVLPPCR